MITKMIIEDLTRIMMSYHDVRPFGMTTGISISISMNMLTVVMRSLSYHDVGPYKMTTSISISISIRPVLYWYTTIEENMILTYRIRSVLYYNTITTVYNRR